MQLVLDYLQENEPRFIRQLCDYVRFPSVSAQSHHRKDVEAAARWLVEQQGAILIGSDTSGLEQLPEPGKPQTFIPVHRYLLTQQGVHIGEFHFLEDLARAKVYEFCYVCMTNKIRGTTAGFCLRPIAMK
jgi:kynurenine formamidase